MPGAEDVATLQITYNLAYALAGPSEQRGDLLRNYLLKTAQKQDPLPWAQLIGADEWSAFPSEALTDVLLLDSKLPGGGRELQKAVENALAQQGPVADERVAAWWDPTESWKLRRLLELLAHQPALVSARAAATIADLPLRDIVAAGPVEGVLQVELDRGSLARRAGDADELAKLASQPTVLPILVRAVAKRQLDASWAAAFVRTASTDVLLTAAKELLAANRFWEDWGEVPLLLLRRLRSIAGPQLAVLSSPLLTAAAQIQPQSHLESYLHLLEVLLRSRKVEGAAWDRLMQPLWEALSHLSNPADRQLVVDVALSGEWACLQPASLVRGDEPRVPWLQEMADRLIAVDEVAGSSRLAPCSGWRHVCPRRVRGGSRSCWTPGWRPRRRRRQPSSFVPAAGTPGIAVRIWTATG